MTGLRAAVIGAGMAGLSCAGELKRNGMSVTVFDKGRGPGGRMATRRAEVDGETVHFDHGAQYFTARDRAFLAWVEKWLAAGVAASWPVAGDDAYVGTPGMNGPVKFMARDQDVRWGTRVTALTRTETGGWALSADGENHLFDLVVAAIPAEQAAELLAGSAPEFAAHAGTSTSLPCWAAMAAFNAPLSHDTDILRSKNGRASYKISWAARNSAKPGRTGPETWVIHACAAFSAEILELSKEDAADALLAAFFAQSGAKPVTPSFLTAHRWLYAMAEQASGETYLWDADQQIGVCGDWLIAPRVEGAWLSGQGLAQAVLSFLTSNNR